MACIVYQTDKKTGIKYAYESISYWDKEKKQPRSKRKYIGKVDPVTGEIIHSGEKSVLSEDTTAALEALKNQIAERDGRIKELEKELATLKRKCTDHSKIIARIARLASDTVEE